MAILFSLEKVKKKLLKLLFFLRNSLFHGVDIAVIRCQRKNEPLLCNSLRGQYLINQIREEEKGHILDILEGHYLYHISKR